MLNRGNTALPYEPYYPAQRVKAVFKSKNLFNVKSLTFNWNKNYVTVNPDGSLTVNAYNVGSKESLLYYVPDLKADKAYTLSLQMDSDSPYIYLYGTKRIWRSGQSLVLTQADLDANFNFYGSNSIYTAPLPTPTTIWDIMINEGTTALPYEPYLPLTKFKAIPKSRNLLPYPYYVFINGNSVYEANGITYTLLADGGIYAKGTATAGAYCSLAGQGVFDLGDSIVVNNSETVKTNGDFTLSKYGSAAKDIVLSFDCNNKTLWLRVDANKSIDGVVYPMLNKGDTAFPYEPPQEIWL
jgi:hypothetical protein